MRRADRIPDVLRVFFIFLVDDPKHDRPSTREVR
jgi:hypothetical protein